MGWRDMGNGLGGVCERVCGFGPFCIEFLRRNLQQPSSTHPTPQKLLLTFPPTTVTSNHPHNHHHMFTPRFVQRGSAQLLRSRPSTTTTIRTTTYSNRPFQAFPSPNNYNHQQSHHSNRTQTRFTTTPLDTTTTKTTITTHYHHPYQRPHLKTTNGFDPLVALLSVTYNTTEPGEEEKMIPVNYDQHLVTIDPAKLQSIIQQGQSQLQTQKLEAGGGGTGGLDGENGEVMGQGEDTVATTSSSSPQQEQKRPRTALDELILIYHIKRQLAAGNGAISNDGKDGGDDALEKSEDNTTRTTTSSPSSSTTESTTPTTITTHEQLSELESTATTILYSKISSIYHNLFPSTLRGIAQRYLTLGVFCLTILGTTTILEFILEKGLPIALPMFSQTFDWFHEKLFGSGGGSGQPPNTTLPTSSSTSHHQQQPNFLLQTSIFRLLTTCMTRSFDLLNSNWWIGPGIGLYFWSVLQLVFWAENWAFYRSPIDVKVLWDSMMMDIIREAVLIKVRDEDNGDSTATTTISQSSSTLTTTPPPTRQKLVDHFFQSYGKKDGSKMMDPGATTTSAATATSSPSSSPPSSSQFQIQTPTPIPTPLRKPITLDDYIKLQSTSYIQGWIDWWYCDLNKSHPIL